MESCKVIDLLNKIANGEKVPKKIIINNIIFERTESFDITQMYNFWDGNYNHFWLTSYTILLDEEIEIIEEEKEIEELDYTYVNSYGNISQHKKSEEPIIDKINELVREIKKLKKEGK